MPLIAPEQTFSGDQQSGQKVSWPDAYRDVVTAATTATTHTERGLGHGDKSGDSRHFLRASAVMLDRLFEWV